MESAGWFTLYISQALKFETLVLALQAQANIACCCNSSYGNRVLRTRYMCVCVSVAALPQAVTVLLACYRWSDTASVCCQGTTCLACLTGCVLSGRKSALQQFIIPHRLVCSHMAQECAPLFHCCTVALAHFQCSNSQGVH